MKLVILLIIFCTSSCTSFKINENGLRRSCQSGINKYDDGQLSFSCYNQNKEDK